MFNFINQLGMFGFPIFVIAITILALTVKFGIALWGPKQDTTVDINSILLLGLSSVALGLYSHYLGMYQASGFLAQMKPAQIAAGYGQSLRALLYGFGIFSLSAVAWFILRYKQRKLRLSADPEKVNA